MKTSTVTVSDARSVEDAMEKAVRLSTSRGYVTAVRFVSVVLTPAQYGNDAEWTYTLEVTLED